MDMSLWESLLKDVEDLKKKPPSAANTAKIQSLLTQVAALTGAPVPTAGDEAANDRPVAAQGEGNQPTALTVVARPTGDVADAPFVVGYQESRKGLVLPSGEFAPEDAGRVANDGLPTLLRIAGKGNDKTTEDVATLAQMGDGVLRLYKSDPEAFKKLPQPVQEFARTLDGKLRERQKNFFTLGNWDVKPGDAPLTRKVNREAWDRWVGEDAASALDEAVVAPERRRALVKGVADIPAYFGKGVKLFGGSEVVNEAVEKYGKVVEAYLGRSEEFKNLKSLDRAEAVGNVIGIFLASRVAATGLGALGAGGMITEGGAMGVTGLTAGGQVAQDLEKEGISGDRAKAAGIAATAGNIILPIVIAKAVKGLAPQSVQQPIAWIARSKVGSSVIGGAVNEIAKAVAKDAAHPAAEPEDSRMEDLRKLLIDG